MHRDAARRPSNAQACKKAPRLFATYFKRCQRCVVVRLVLDFPARVPSTGPCRFHRSRPRARAVRPLSGPLVTSTPVCLCEVMAAERRWPSPRFSMPSVVQKGALAAKGRSPDTTTTTVLSSPAAATLKLARGGGARRRVETRHDVQDLALCRRSLASVRFAQILADEGEISCFRNRLPGNVPAHVDRVAAEGNLGSCLLQNVSDGQEIRASPDRGRTRDAPREKQRLANRKKTRPRKKHA